MVRNSSNASGQCEKPPTASDSCSVNSPKSMELATIRGGVPVLRRVLSSSNSFSRQFESSMMAAALSKLAGSEGALAGALASVEIHGARGYVSEYGVERDLRNLSGGVI